jgi:KaiC/GvpD/RAD55 family RecA-like ATPase/5S rRNA maturation endonuclease (ribonuclease M5)
MGNCVRHERCPQCAAKGGDSTGNNLAIYDNGGAYCFACGYAVGDKYKGQTQNNEVLNVMPVHTVETILGKRGISPEAIKAYDVQAMQDDATGEVFINFPICDVNGKPMFSQRRIYNPNTGELSRDMKFAKGTKLNNPLFGWQLVTRKTKTLLICEGNTDTLTAASRLTKYPAVTVVGIVGAANAKRAAAQIVRHAPKLNIVLALDNDEAGQEAKEAFVDYFRDNLPDNALRELRFNYKDLNDWLTTEPDVDLGDEVVNAEPVLGSDIVGSNEITDAFIEYLDAIEHEKYVTLQFSPTLSNTLRLMPGKLVGVAGDSGKGKSTLVEQIALEALADGRNVFFVSAEMRPAEVALKLVRNARGVNYYDKAVLENMTDVEREDLRSFTRALLRKLKMFARFGSCGVDEIEQKLHELTAANVAPDLIIIDHILAIAKEGSTEELESIAKNMKALAERFEVPIIILSHVRKQQQQNKRTVYRPQLSDLYNSGGLGRYADIVLGVGLDPEKRITYVETIKMERMGGGYADLMLRLVDWSLQELDEDATNRVSWNNNSVEEADDYEEELL